MATPIKDTPVLRGKEAERFWAEAERVYRESVKVPKAEYERIMAVYRSVRVAP